MRSFYNEIKQKAAYCRFSVEIETRSQESLFQIVRYFATSHLIIPSIQKKSAFSGLFDMLNFKNLVF